MNFKSPYNLAILAIVLYSTSMLVYGTLRIFIGEKIDAISAFGSVLSAIGAFFAAFVALIIFDGWKIQHNKNLSNKYAEQVIEAYNKYSISVLNFNIFTSGIDISRLRNNASYFNVEINSTLEKIDHLREDVNKSFEEFKFKLNYYGIISGDSENIQLLITTLNHKFFKINNLEPTNNIFVKMHLSTELSIGYQDLSNMIISSCLQSILKSMKA